MLLFNGFELSHTLLNKTWFSLKFLCSKQSYTSDKSHAKSEYFVSHRWAQDHPSSPPPYHPYQCTFQEFFYCWYAPVHTFSCLHHLSRQHTHCTHDAWLESDCSSRKTSQTMICTQCPCSSSGSKAFLWSRTSRNRSTWKIPLEACTCPFAQFLMPHLSPWCKCFVGIAQLTNSM